MNNNELETKLQGSGRQITWAEEIRQKKVNGLSKLNPDSDNFDRSLAIFVRNSLVEYGYDEYMPDAQKGDMAEAMDKLKKIYEDAMQKISSIDSAKWFIDYRYGTDAMSTIPKLFPDKKNSGKRFGQMEGRLQGSEKQIAWAEEIRQKKINGLSKLNPDSDDFDRSLAIFVRNSLKAYGYDEYMPDAQKRDKAEAMGKLKKIYEDAMQKISSIDSARWFIDYRYGTDAMSTIPELFPDKKNSGKGFGW